MIALIRQPEIFAKQPMYPHIVIPAQAGILLKSRQWFVFYRYLRVSDKIPACAGMTASVDFQAVSVSSGACHCVLGRKK